MHGVKRVQSADFKYILDKTLYKGIDNMSKIEGIPNLCWPQFEIMNDDESGSFEDMCRALFKNEFVQEGVALHSNHNNPGVEVDPVPARFHKGKKQFFISFQSKYYKMTLIIQI